MTPTDQPETLAPKQYDDQSLEPTSPAAWGQRPRDDEPGFIVELPSGNVAKMRRTMDIQILLSTGQIPNPLAEIVSGMQERGEQSFPQTDDPLAVRQLLDLLDATVVRTFIEPKVSRPFPQGCDPEIGTEETVEQYHQRIRDWKPDPGTLSIWQIGAIDKVYVFQIAQGAAASLATFRERQATALGDIQAVEGLEGAASRTDGAPGTNRASRRAASKPAKSGGKKSAATSRTAKKRAR